MNIEVRVHEDFDLGGGFALTQGIHDIAIEEIPDYAAAIFAGKMFFALEIRQLEGLNTELNQQIYNLYNAILNGGGGGGSLEIGADVTGADPNSVLFTDADSQLAQDPLFVYDPATGTLGVEKIQLIKEVEGAESIVVLSEWKSTDSSNNYLGAGVGNMDNALAGANSYFGSDIALNDESAGYNSAFGWRAGKSIDTASEVSLFGASAGQNVTTASSIAAFGRSALFNTTTGHSNTAVGAYAGYSNVTGIGSVFLGASAGYNETESNKLYIANSDTDTPLIYGEFDNELLRVHGEFVVRGEGEQFKIEWDENNHFSAIVDEWGSPTFDIDGDALPDGVIRKFTFDKPLEAKFVDYLKADLPVTGIESGTVARLLDDHKGLMLYNGNSHWISVNGGIYDVTYFGAKGDGKSGIGVSITSGTNTLTILQSKFSLEDVGKPIMIAGAGVSGKTLFTTIVGFNSATQVAIADNASTTVVNTGLPDTRRYAVWGTDDTAAIQAAIDAAKASSTGGEVYFPKTSGFYKVDGVLDVSVSYNVLLRSVGGKGSQQLTTEGAIVCTSAQTQSTFDFGPGDIDSAGIITKTAHGLVSGQELYLSSTGTLPTVIIQAIEQEITQGLPYAPILVKRIDADHFQLVQNFAGTVFYTIISSGSGIHTATTRESGLINCRSSHSIKLQNLRIVYANPDFNGFVVDMSRVMSHGDPHYPSIEDCNIRGLDGFASNAAALICLDLAIIADIKTSELIIADVGVLGRIQGGYSNAVNVLGCSFGGFKISSIKNAHENWLIQGCTFEPNWNGIAAAYSEDAALPSIGPVVFDANWFGDIFNATASWIYYSGFNLVFARNQMATAGSATNPLIVCGTLEGDTGIVTTTISLKQNSFYGAKNIVTVPTGNTVRSVTFDSDVLLPFGSGYTLVSGGGTVNSQTVLGMTPYFINQMSGLYIEGAFNANVINYASDIVNKEYGTIGDLPAAFSGANRVLAIIGRTATVGSVSPIDFMTNTGLNAYEITPANISLSPNQINITHNFQTGEALMWEALGDNLPPAPFLLGQYFAIRDSGTVLRLAASYADALLGTSVTMTNVGSGTTTLHRAPVRRMRITDVITADVPIHAPTAAPGTNTVQVATTAFVQAALTTSGVTASSTTTFTNKTMSGASNTFSAIPQSAITSLVTDLAAKADLASNNTFLGRPTFAGSPDANAGNIVISSPLDYGGISFYSGATLRGILGFGDAGAIISGATADSMTLSSVNGMHFANGNTLAMSIIGGVVEIKGTLWLMDSIGKVIQFGANDSGGTGYKMLRVANT